ncbi:hypothetical protein OKW38_002947 [Paraburkholderia sp. MM5496-R1]
MDGSQDGGAIGIGGKCTGARRLNFGAVRGGAFCCFCAGRARRVT